MATISEIKALGDTATVVSSPLVEPLNAPLRFEDRLARFGDHYNTNHDSHLYKFLLALCGDAGAGSLKREKLYPRLQSILGSTYFQDLDKLYGNPIGISRLPAELYIYDPHNEALTAEQWTEVFAKDASYRERCLTWMRAIIEGPTPRGIELAAEAACGIECDVYENYKYLDNTFLGLTSGQVITSGSQFIIPNVDAKLSNQSGWIAFKFVPGWGSSDTPGTPVLFEWQGVQNTGYIKGYFDQTGDNWVIERSNEINPDPQIHTHSASHSADSTVYVTARWTDDKIAITVASDDSPGSTTVTDITPIYGGTLTFGNDDLDAEIQAVIMGTGTVPTQATLVPLLASSPVDPSSLPSNSTFYWSDTSDPHFYSTGTDTPVVFPIVPSSTNSRNEFTILPRVTDLEAKEIRAISRLVDKLRPVDTIATISAGSNPRNELPILDVAATSSRFTVLRNVTGNSNIDWPELDPAAGYWIDETTRQAPTFAFLDRQEAATYLSIKGASASSEHTGQYNAFQRSLFSHLNNLSGLVSFPVSKIYAKAVAPLNITTPWLSNSDQEKLIVNNHYPIGYFAKENIDISIAQNSFDFWSSKEAYAPATEEVIIDLDVTRPFNFIDFNISQKPIDITIEYNDNGEWKPIEIKEGYEATYSISYLPSLDNPWSYVEYNFEMVNSDKIRFTFARRSELFPVGNTTDNPWSIEVKNLRVIHLIQTIDDFIIDTGTDILGNVFETDILEYGPENVVDPDDPGVYSYWQSQPNPTRQAVEALYFDLRDNAVQYDMADLDEFTMEELDLMSVSSLANNYIDSVIVDEVFINPISNGADMHFYYSTDDVPDWDNKLWIPIPENYILRRGYFALPSPTAVKYFKIEFSNLTPIPYQFIEYPNNITTRFRRYPTWVQNYFHDLYPIDPYEESIEVVDIIKVDPLEYGYQHYIDAMNTGYKEVRAVLFHDTDEEIRGFIENVIKGGLQQRIDTQDIEQQIHFYSPLMYQTDLLSALDPTRAATRRVQELLNPLLNDSEWMSEVSLPITTPPVQKSVTSLAEQAAELRTPTMFFPRAVRHQYQVLEGRFKNKVAYQVAIRDVKFLRRDLTVKIDEYEYLETLEDEAHLTDNSLIRLDTYRWGVS